MFNSVHIRFSSPAFKQGAAIGRREMLQIAPGIGAWGLVTGVAMINSGLPLPVALTLGLMVFAGSAQLAAIPLMAAGAPVWLIIATAACVNLRFVIFSAQLRPYFEHLPLRWRIWCSYILGDLTAVLFMQRYKDANVDDATERDGIMGYYLSAGLTNWLAWNIPQALGIALAAFIPTQWGLSFAGILALLGITLSLIQDKLTATTAAVAALVAVVFVALPLKLNLLIAVAVGMALAMGWQWALEKQLSRNEKKEAA